MAVGSKDEVQESSPIQTSWKRKRGAWTAYFIGCRCLVALWDAGLVGCTLHAPSDRAKHVADLSSWTDGKIRRRSSDDMASGNESGGSSLTSPPSKALRGVSPICIKNY